MGARFITLFAIVFKLLISPLGLRVRDEASRSVKRAGCLSLDPHA